MGLPLRNTANNARGPLNSTISAGAMSFTLQSGRGALFPASNFRVTLKDYSAGVLISQEIVHVSSRAGDVFTISTRGAESCPRTDTSTSSVTTAYSFTAYTDASNGTVVELTPTAGMVDEISTEITTLNTGKLSISDYISGAKLYDDSTNGTDAYAITLADVTSYAQIDGQVIRVKCDVANTGSATLQINALGAKSIVKFGGDALQDNDIRAGQIAEFIWDNTQNAFELKDAIDQSGTIQASNLVDTTFYAGESITAGQVVFVEGNTTFALSTTLQNIGDVTANTRVAIPVFGTGVNFTTLKLALRKFVAPGVDLGVRIETDSAGSPSGTIVTNGSTTVTSASLTTSLVDTTVTFGGNVNLTVGQKYWIVLFAGTYGSETINATNYFAVGYDGADHTTTRGIKVRNATVYSAGPSFMAYVSSTGILDNVLSLTDADYTYKIEYHGISESTSAIGGNPRICINGIQTNQSGLTYNTDYYISGTPGAITSTAPSNAKVIGRAISSSKIYVLPEQRPNYVSSIAVSGSVAVPTGINLVIIEATCSDGTRLQKGDIILTKFGKTTGQVQAGETNGSSNFPNFTATWSGSTITITGNSVGGTVYFYRNL